MLNALVEAALQINSASFIFVYTEIVRTKTVQKWNVLNVKSMSPPLRPLCLDHPHIAGVIPQMSNLIQVFVCHRRVNVSTACTTELFSFIVKWRHVWLPTTFTHCSVTLIACNDISYCFAIFIHTFGIFMRGYASNAGWCGNNDIHFITILKSSKPPTASSTIYCVHIGTLYFHFKLTYGILDLLRNLEICIIIGRRREL
jgi:hypothetical protein